MADNSKETPQAQPANQPRVNAPKTDSTDPALKEFRGPRTADPIKFGAVKPVAEQEKDRIEKETGQRPKDADFQKALDPVGAADLRTAIMNVVNAEFANRGLQAPQELDQMILRVSENAAQGHYKIPSADVTPDGRPKDQGSSIAAREAEKQARENPTPKDRPAPAPRP